MLLFSPISSLLLLDISAAEVSLSCYPEGSLSDLCYTDNKDTTGSLFEITGGWAAQTRWQRAGGHSFPNDKPYSPEDVLANWNIITNFGT